MSDANKGFPQSALVMKIMGWALIISLAVTVYKRGAGEYLDTVGSN